MGAVFQPRVLADFLVVLISSQVHAKNRVVVIRAGKLSCGVGNQHFDQLFYIYAARADDFNTDALGHVTRLYCTLSSHKNVLSGIEFPMPRMLLLPAVRGKIGNSNDFHRNFLCRDRRCEMEVHQLRYFCEVVRQGTFTRASEAQKMAQPSLSQQILTLEAELGGQLFDRMPRSAKLTVFGKVFLPRAERILRELKDAKTEKLEMTSEEKCVLVLGGIPTITPYLLPPLLDCFSRRHPSVHIRIIEEVTSVLLERLHQGSIDMAIVALPVSG